MARRQGRSDEIIIKFREAKVLLAKRIEVVEVVKDSTFLGASAVYHCISQ
ncbi:hypothetical protein KAU37_07815 [Candidatus Bipolaricaulota bacterium]|nr:hypothetical protein [Candidatus Bipolaricaulota bacterium]